jgi:tRNA(Arg) A34 adenosine deaminase TadA
MCFGAILWANITSVKYGCNTKDTELIGFRDDMFFAKQNIFKNQYYKELGRDECLKLYNRYNSIKDKVNY